jgi:erythromycin esterase-like protein
MARHGLVSVGQLVRERQAARSAALVGFAGHRGSVLAASSWGAPEQAFLMPQARGGSHEDLLHHTLGQPAALVFSDDRSGPWLSAWLGHRAIGVVYDPQHEAGNYIPTCIGQRYDALIWLEQTTSLRPLHHERRPQEPELETEPTGF